MASTLLSVIASEGTHTQHAPAAIASENIRKKTKFYHEPQAYIYVRVSSDYQDTVDSNSFATQKSMCEELCNKLGIPVARIIEQVKSGYKFRKELANVVEKELQRGDVLCVYSISRFARSQKITHDLMEVLTKKKCRLLSVRENIDTEVNGNMVGLYAWVSEIERSYISQRVSDCMQQKRKRGEHIGRLPFGYKYLEGRGSPLVEDPDRYPIFLQMKKWRFEENLSYCEIARRLNQEGVTPPSERNKCGWNHVAVQLIVTRKTEDIAIKGKPSWYEEKEKQKITTTTATTEETQFSQSSGATTMQQPMTTNTNAQPTYENLPLVVLRAIIKKDRLRYGMGGVDDATIDSLDKLSLLTLLQ